MCFSTVPAGCKLNFELQVLDTQRCSDVKIGSDKRLGLWPLEQILGARFNPHAGIQSTSALPFLFYFCILRINAQGSFIMPPPPQPIIPLPGNKTRMTQQGYISRGVEL